MEGKEESRAQNTDTDPWKFPRRNRDHTSKWVGQGKAPGMITVQEPRGPIWKPSDPPFPVWLQRDLFLYHKEFHWSLSLVLRRENLYPWISQVKRVLLLTLSLLGHTRANTNERVRDDSGRV